MCKSTTLFGEHYKTISKDVFYNNVIEVLNATKENVLYECSLIPAFPDVDLVTNISGQRYEKQDCYSNMAFVPQNLFDDDMLSIQYDEPVLMNKYNVRTIRKLLEAVDDEHCLVFIEGDNNPCKVVGIARYDVIKDKMITVIKITGHMTWEAYICDFPMFQYANGSYDDISNKEFTVNEFKEKFLKRFKNSLSCMTEENVEALINNFCDTIKIITKLNHGTSLVIMDNNSYETEIKRLLMPGAGHGTKLKKPINLTNKTAVEAEEILTQVTKIDGGLLVNLNGVCDAIGCIFDGKVFPEFKGNIGRGSRYNSVKLYVDGQNIDNQRECLGVIISDDGSVDYI